MGKAKDHREAELKFDLDRHAAKKVRQHPLLADRDPTTQSQTSVYFDTGKRRIGRAGYSLRVRQSGDGHIQTVKSTGGGAGLFDRAEWEVPVEGLEVDAKALKSTPLRKLKRLDKLEPQVRSTVERATWLIDRDGSLIEVVLDEGMVEAGDETAKFQELEMELRQGTTAELFGFAKQLAEDIPLEIGVLSKEERGLLLAERALDHEQKAREPAISEEMCTGQAFVATVQECVRHFRLNQALIIAERNPAALHQARVAMRRLRTAFTLFGPVIREGSLEPLKCELKAFIEPFGVARNLDVYLDKHGGVLGWRDQQVLQSARAESYNQVVEALNSQQKRDMLVDLVEWTTSADWQRTGASRPIAKFAERRLDDAWNKVKRGGARLGKLQEQDLHRLRINIKKLRYSAEFLAPLYRKKRVQKFAASLERLQDCLGLIHDDMISREIISTYELAESGQTEISDRSRQLAKMGGRFKQLRRANRFWR